MKNVLIIAIACFAFASCTKDYTCSCLDNNTQETSKLVFKTNKKSHATRLCNDYADRVRNAVTDQEDYSCSID